MSKNILTSVGEVSPRYFTVREAAGVLGMSTQTLWRRIRMKELNPLTVDRRYVIPAHMLKRLASDQVVRVRPYRRAVVRSDLPKELNCE